MRPLSILALALSACVSVPPGGAPYSAAGTEPFWSIQIDRGRMTFEAPEGSFSVPASAPVETSGGRRYQSARIILDATPWVCTDGMSDNLYAETVTAVVDGTTFYGCGGGTVPHDELVNSRWTIEEIDGRPVGEGDYRVDFGSGQLTGVAGCNRFSGPYSRSGDTLAAGPLAATRMTCPEPRMEHERRVLQLLSAPLRLGFDEAGGLLLAGEGSIRLRRDFHAPYP
jgi:heat shock protein HslJ